MTTTLVLIGPEHWTAKNWRILGERLTRDELPSEVTATIVTRDKNGAVVKLEEVGEDV